AILAADVFLLGNTSWRIRHVRGGEVTVVDAQGSPATIPFWLGEAPGRTIELSQELSNLREEIWRRAAEAIATKATKPAAQARVSPFDAPARETLAYAASSAETFSACAAASHVAWLKEECGADEWAARQAVEYVAAQAAAIGLIPTQRRVVF